MTKPLEIEELERQLETPVPDPPPALLAALKEEIPEDLVAAAPAAPGAARARRWQLVAATLALAVVGLVIGDRVRRQVPMAAGETEEEAPQMTLIAPAPPPPPESPAETAGSATGEGHPARELQQQREQLLERLKVIEGPPPGLADADAAVGGDAGGRESAAGAPGAERQKELRPPAAAGETRDVLVGQTAAAAPPLPEPAPAPPPPSAVDLQPGPQRREIGPAPPLPGEARASDAGARPSTGGTSEPNDRPYGDMFFESAGVNPFIDTEDDPYSTFGLDVDTGSYTLARSYLERGHLPPAEAIRVEEFVNFFSYGDEPPRRGDFALSVEGAPSPFAAGPRYQVLRFGLHGREIDRADRQPAVLVFVVDVSGSMGRDNRLGLVRRSLRLLLDQLDAEDRVGLVVYGSRGRVLLEPTGDHRAIGRAIDRLVPEGATNAEEGLVLGYELARRHFREGAIHRVILCSDGVANVGRTGPESILSRIEAASEEGIELTTVGFGMGNYNDVLMEQLADRGDGRYAYVDTVAEARRLFVDDLSGTLATIASDAKVQVEFNPEVVLRYRLLGYENRDIADERFRDDTVDAGEIGAGHEVSAVYEVKLAPDVRPRQRLARLSLRYRSAATGEVEETSVDVAVRDLAPSWDAAPAGLRLASVVAEFAEILRRSYWAREGDLGDLLRRAQELSPAFAGDADVAELVSLIAKAERSRAD